MTPPMTPGELPIVQKTYDLIKWYVPILSRLPRDPSYPGSAWVRPPEAPPPGWGMTPFLAIKYHIV
jgi:hypothetical protein